MPRHKEWLSGLSPVRRTRFFTVLEIAVILDINKKRVIEHHKRKGKFNPVCKNISTGSVFATKREKKFWSVGEVTGNEGGDL